MADIIPFPRKRAAPIRPVLDFVPLTGDQIIAALEAATAEIKRSSEMRWERMLGISDSEADGQDTIKSGVANS